MNKFRLLLILATALLVASSFSYAHEAKHKMKFMIDGDGDAIEIGEMEVGETRQFFTDSGKEVVITREEQGYDLSVDGREIDILSGDHHGASAFVIDREDGEGKVEVMVKKLIAGEGDDDNVFVFSGDGEEHEGHGFHKVFVTADGVGEGHHKVSVVMEGKSVAEQVKESGVLDTLDEATRQEVLDEIEKASGHRVVHTGTSAVWVEKNEDE